MTVTSLAVATMKFLSGMCNCMIDSDVGKDDFLLALGVLHMLTRASAITRASGHGLINNEKWNSRTFNAYCIATIPVPEIPSLI